MASATVTVSVKDIAEVKALIEAARKVERAWDRLCRCNDEFLPEYPGACGELSDELDTAIIALVRILNGGDHAD